MRILVRSWDVVFYDMGSSSTYAALLYFSSYKSKEYGKTVSVNQFQVKDVCWNPGLGRQHMELPLVEYFANEFNAKYWGSHVRKFPKAMAKLKKQVKRTNEILSANPGAPITVESLHGDVDFETKSELFRFLASPTLAAASPPSQKSPSRCISSSPYSI